MAISKTLIQVKFSESIVTLNNTNGDNFDPSGAGFDATAAAINTSIPNDSIIDVTVADLGNTTFTSSDLDVAANTVEDANGNGNLADLDNSIVTMFLSMA